LGETISVTAVKNFEAAPLWMAQTQSTGDGIHMNGDCSCGLSIVEETGLRASRYRLYFACGRFATLRL